MRGRRGSYHTSEVGFSESSAGLSSSLMFPSHPFTSWSTGFRFVFPSYWYILMCSFPGVPVLSCLLLLCAAESG